MDRAADPSGPAGFASHPAGVGALHTDPALPVIPLRSVGGGLLGYFLGYPIDIDAGRLVAAPLSIVVPPIPVDGEQADRPWIEEHVYRFGGTFVFLAVDAAEPGLYLDAAGSLGAVFSAKHGIAASTESLLLHIAGPDARPDEALRTALDTRRDGWLAAGLTAYADIDRVMTNHRLSLTRFEQDRHWPCAALPLGDPDQIVAQLGDDIARTCAAISGTGRATFTLTAGNESRLLLACVRDHVDKVDFATIRAPGAQMDLWAARQLASRFGLRHRLLSLVRATPAEQEIWSQRVGYSMAGANRLIHPTLRPLKGRFLVGGLGGEVGRGFLWGQVRADDAVDAVGIVDRLKLNRHPLLLRRVERWLSRTPPGIDVFLLLDLAYLELRMASWAYAQSYCVPDPVLFSPISSRRTYVAMFSLDPQVRREGFIRRVINQRWPELLALPINSYGDIRDRLHVARRVLSYPGRAFRKLRRMVRLRA